MFLESGYDSYQQVDLDAQAAAASPHQLVVMLIDGLLNEIERTRGHMTAGRLEQKGTSIAKSMNILIGLDSALDQDRGGEVAQNLHQLYDFCQMELYQASLNNDVDKLTNVERVMANIRDGWMNFGQHA